MNYLIKDLGIGLFSLAIAALLAFPITALMKKIKAGQPILKYVELHKGKSGTPTMGGIIFIAAAVIATMIFGGSGLTLGKAAALIMTAFALLGFTDDFLKIRLKKNEGLKAWQKLIFQLIIAGIVAWYCYENPYIGTTVNLPFTEKTVELAWFSPILTVLVVVATVNAVNLTDGLDGLATGTGLYYFLTFAIVTVIMITNAEYQKNLGYSEQLQSLLYFETAVIGGLLVFFTINSNPANIFMGDTGSLALGGAAATVAVFGKNPFLVLIVGIMYAVSCITVIVQVFWFKVSGGKRVFLMAPLHHHLQMKGLSENKIVSLYSVVTFVAGVICIIGVLAGVYGFDG